ncbi:MAG: hypothetical protein FIA97_09165 [Methylococcaceae bacterium]|nr:hypothetical protein [Methylococcaceae bacterium]
MMARKPKKPAASETEKFPRKHVPLTLRESDSEDAVGRKFAALLRSPELAASRVISAAENNTELGKFLDVPGLHDELRSQAAAVNRGDLSQAEAMLANQATALQSLFARLTEKALGTNYMPQFEGFMRMALRAQSQCRATLETLAAIKNPPVVYARQANVTTGPQQINNGMAAASRAREIETEQTQLSGETHELLSDARTSGDACRVNPTLEALGEVDRAEVPQR